MLHVTSKMEGCRITTGEWASRIGSGPNGMFFVRRSPRHHRLKVIISNGMGWEHASVSAPGRTPSWEDMQFVKECFWERDDVVMQLHPAEEDYMNFHPYCLHLWRPLDAEIPTPPLFMVAPGKKMPEGWKP
jgi:hypothetical protein